MNGARLDEATLGAVPSEVTAVQNATLLLQAQQLKIQAQIDLLEKQKELDALSTVTAP